MASLSPPLGVARVSKSLNSASGDIGTNVEAQNLSINIYSKNKPVIIDQPQALTQAQILQANCGNYLYIGSILNQMVEIENGEYGRHLSPTGTQWKRLTDMVGYNPYATPWFQYSYPSEIGDTGTIYVEEIADFLEFMFTLGVASGLDPTTPDVNFGFVGGNNPYDVDFYIPITDEAMLISDLEGGRYQFNASLLGEGTYYLYPVLTTNRGSLYPRLTKLTSFNKTSGWLPLPFVTPLRIVISQAFVPDPVDDIYITDLYNEYPPTVEIEYVGADILLDASQAFVRITNESNETRNVHWLISVDQAIQPAQTITGSTNIGPNATLEPFDILTSSFNNVKLYIEFVTLTVTFWVPSSDPGHDPREKTTTVYLTEK